jgi:hypothetical protein
MLDIGADPPQVHRRKGHGRGQFAPDFATGIKSALLYLREYRAAYAGLPGELPLREPEALPVIQDHPGQRPRFPRGRTRAFKELDRTAWREDLQKRGITLLGGALDEAPAAYKDVGSVMAAQADLVEAIGEFSPRIVRMDAGSKKRRR